MLGPNNDDPRHKDLYDYTPGGEVDLSNADSVHAAIEQDEANDVISAEAATEMLENVEVQKAELEADEERQSAIAQVEDPRKGNDAADFDIEPK